MKRFLMALIMLFLLFSAIPSLAEQAAEDITASCTYNGYIGTESKLADGDYFTVWRSVYNEGMHSLTICAPQGKTIGALLIHWDNIPLALIFETMNKEGKWERSAVCNADFYAQGVKLESAKAVRFYCRVDSVAQLEISEIRVMTPGELPADFQLWQKAPEKVDIMMWVGHPDDEVLWFGGLLPYYAGERKKNVLVVCASMNSRARRHELLDCLWECGVRIYPVFAKVLDYMSNDYYEVLEKWGGQEKVLWQYTGYLRQYKPDVLMLHDQYGETYHGVHIALSWLGRKTPDLACDAKVYPEQVAQYGTWDVKKVYIHLWPENQMRMDWSAPMESFGGRTGYEVAADAFAKHTSQQGVGYAIKKGGKTDCELFGLWRTTVGPDRLKNDLLENIE